MIDRIVQLFEPITDIDPRWALVALGLQLCNLVCRAIAWRNVLAAAYPEDRLSPVRVGLAYAVGVGLNGYLPARGGEAAKVALVRMQHPSTAVATVAASTTVVLVFDTFLGVTLLAIAWATGSLPAAPTLPAVPLGATTIIALAAVALAAGIGLTALMRRYGPRMRAAVGQLVQGLRVLRNPARYARTVLTAQAGAWCCRIATVYCLLQAFGISGASLPIAALVVVVGGMSTLVPVPGGAGSQQALAVYILSGIATAGTAFAYSVGAQVVVTLVNTSIGALAAMIIFRRLHPVAAIRDAIRAARATHPIPTPIAPGAPPAIAAATGQTSA